MFSDTQSLLSPRRDGAWLIYTGSIINWIRIWGGGDRGARLGQEMGIFVEYSNTGAAMALRAACSRINKTDNSLYSYAR